jgi:hypothetical protein
MRIDHLFELDWHDGSPVARALERHRGRGRYVHFSRVLKMGFNPRKSHADPHGIYFYPVDWILDRDNAPTRSGDLWGLTYPYWFVAEIDKQHAPGLTLSDVQWEDVQAIAAMNGWRDDMEENIERGGWSEWMGTYSSVAVERPGPFFWDFVHELDRTKRMTFARSLRGLGWIEDDGLGLIHDEEPEQLIVFDRRLIRVVDSGRQSDWTGLRRDFNYWRPAVATLMQQAAKRFAGTVTWQTRRPVANFTVDDMHFTLAVEEHPFAVYLHWRGPENGKSLISNDPVDDEIITMLDQIERTIASVGGSR